MWQPLGPVSGQTLSWLWALCHCPVGRSVGLSTLVQLFIKDIYAASFCFPSTLTRLPVPAAEITPTAWCCHHYASQSGGNLAGDERSLVFLQTWRFELRPNNLILVSSDHREPCFSQSESPLGAFVYFHVSVTEERLLSGHSGTEPRSVECYCPSGSFSLSHFSYQGLRPPDCSVLPGGQPEEKSWLFQTSSIGELWRSLFSRDPSM